jgi:hypothetical protein
MDGPVTSLIFLEYKESSSYSPCRLAHVMVGPDSESSMYGVMCSLVLKT